MHERFSFAGTFSFDIYEGEYLVAKYKFHNKILRVGLRAVVQNGVQLAGFNYFNIGKSLIADSSSLPGVLDLLPGGNKVGNQLPLIKPQWGFTTAYLPGEATGQWSEIGMSTFNGVFINRARFTDENGTPAIIDKQDNQRIVATVVFELKRT
jgi:hypothetical protein